MSAMTKTSASVSMGEQLWGRPAIGNVRALLIHPPPSLTLYSIFFLISLTISAHRFHIPHTPMLAPTPGQEGSDDKSGLTPILAPTPGQEGSDDKSGLIAGVVIGITVVAIVTPAILVISAYFMYTKHKKREAL